MNNNPIVGHKTMSDESGEKQHMPLYKNEADEIMAKIEANKKSRDDLMPDEKAALLVLHEAYLRLQELGWKEISGCPKDGSIFNIIEVGSMGIYQCNYLGEWPNGKWWVHDADDLWPSRPILFKLDPEEEEKKQKRLSAAIQKIMKRRD